MKNAKPMDRKTGNVENFCIECGRSIAGRKDKKFCSTACKNAHNNRIGQQARQCRAIVEKRLSRNYRILESLMCEKVESVRLEDIAPIGFDSECLTEIRRNGLKHTECRCYDIAYRKTDSRISRIRRLNLNELLSDPSPDPSSRQ